MGQNSGGLLYCDEPQTVLAIALKFSTVNASIYLLVQRPLDNTSKCHCREIALQYTIGSLSLSYFCSIQVKCRAVTLTHFVSKPAVSFYIKNPNVKLYVFGLFGHCVFVDVSATGLFCLEIKLTFNVGILENQTVFLSSQEDFRHLSHDLFCGFCEKSISLNLNRFNQ